jgi:hypothetical protein
MRRIGEGGRERERWIEILPKSERETEIDRWREIERKTDRQQEQETWTKWNRQRAMELDRAGEGERERNYE